MSQRVGGHIYIKVDGELYSAKGSFTHNFGISTREEVIGQDGVHGYTEKPKAAFIEGSITDNIGISVKELCKISGATVTLELANGKTVVLRDAWYSGSGDVTSEEGEVNLKFTSANEAEEVR